jgi:hypothetical protein
MRPAELLVVGETPSLGRSVADLLESEGFTVRLVPDLGIEAPLYRLAERDPVVIVVSNGYFCAAARRYANGEIPGVSLVVVGSRDPVVTAHRAIHPIGLPIQVESFLGLIRSLLDVPEAMPGGESPPAAGAPGPPVPGHGGTA